MRRLIPILLMVSFLATIAFAQPNPPSSLSATYGAIGSIDLTWSAPVDPGAFNEGFESGIPTTWMNIDNDGDTHTWFVLGAGDGWDFVTGGDNAVVSFSYDNATFSALTPDNWLITPQLSLGAAPAFTFNVGGSDASWAQEHYKIMVSTTDASPASFTLVSEETLPAAAWGAFVGRNVDLAAYANQTVYIAVVHNGSTDQFNITFDDLAVSGLATGADWVVDFNDPSDINQFRTAQTSYYPLKKTSDESSSSFKDRMDKYTFQVSTAKAVDSYNVYRNGSMIGNTTDLSYSDTEMTFGVEHTYTVKSVEGSTESAASNEAVGFAYDPASVLGMWDFETTPTDLTIVDANSDAVTWTVYTGSAQSGTKSLSISYSGTTPKDDHAMFGPFTFNAGTNYTFAFSYRVASATWAEDFSVHVYNSSGEPIATISDHAGNVNTTYMDHSDDFTVSATGSYYVGFYAYSPADMWRLSIDDVSLMAGDVIPVELTSFAATSNNSEVVLDWSTATEINNSGFEIERSADNKDFQRIAFIEGKGTTSERVNYSYVDGSVENGTYFYRLKQVDFDGTFEYSSVVEVEVIAPAEFALEQNYPNPFNPTTTIKFSVPTQANVTIKLYNTLGQQVAQVLNSTFDAGRHSVEFNASNLTSGVYLYSVEASGIDGNSFVATKKMMLLK